MFARRTAAWRSAFTSRIAAFGALTPRIAVFCAILAITLTGVAPAMHADVIDGGASVARNATTWRTMAGASMLASRRLVRLERGVFLSGDVDPNERACIFEGRIRQPVLEGVRKIEGIVLSGDAFTAPMAFELERAGAEAPLRLHSRSEEWPVNAATPPEEQRSSSSKPTEQQSASSVQTIQPTSRGVQLQADWAGYRVAVRPEVSEHNELSVGGALASSLWRGAAGVQFLLGAEKRDLLLAGGWHLSPATRLFVTAGHLQQQLPMAFESGTEHVRMTQYAGGVAYQILTGGVLERVDLNVHGSRSASRDLGEQVVLRRSAIEQTLVRIPLRVAGGTIVGADSRIAIRPHPSILLSGQLGGERLVYALAAGRESVSRLTAGAEWMQQLGKGFRFTAGGTSYSAQRTLVLEVGRSLANQQFGLTLTRLVGRDGAPSDLQVRWQHSFTWGRSAPPSSMATTGSDVRTYAGREMLDLVSTRPAFMPIQVVARIDDTVAPTRLVALANDGLPVGAQVDPTTATVTLPEAVTEIVWVTRNGTPTANTGQFAVVNQHLEVRPAAMEEPAHGSDTYVVTLENADHGVTTVTVSVSAGSVRIDRITVSTEARRDAPDSLAFATQQPVPLNTVVTSNTVSIVGINLPVPITVTGGEYAVDDEPFTTTPGHVVNGQSVRVRHQSAPTTATTMTTVLTVGATVARFASITEADTLPDAFSFASRANAEPKQHVLSDTVTVRGIDGPATITITGGEYAVSGGTFTTGAGTILSGQRLQLRVRAASQYATTVTASVTVGGVVATFAVTTKEEPPPPPESEPPPVTPPADTTPSGFVFTPQTQVGLNTAVVSNAITVAGIDAETAISISGGEYALNGGAYTTAAGTVSNGQTVTVRQTSSSSFSTTTMTTLTIGGVSGTFSVTTRPADTTPDAFSFTSQTNVALNTFIVSNAITVSGIEAATSISISGGGDYAINGGAFTQSAGTVTNGQTVTIRQRSANQVSTTSTVTLTIGGVSGTFSVTTEPPDTTPDAFSFTSQTGVTVSTAVTSNTVTITGINNAATVTVTGGEYSTQGNSFTSSAGTISPDGTLRLRQTSSASFSTTTTMTVTVGGVSAAFSVTTEAIDTTPDAFSFTSETNVNLNQTRTSNAITVSGINSPASISVSAAASSEYRINNGSYVSTPGTVSNGDTVRVRHTSASTNSTTTTTTLTIGGVSGSFSTTTRP
jgi:hypothetical protein